MWLAIWLAASFFSCPLLDREPERLWPVLDQWLEDDDLWIRRAAMLAQNKRKAKTDPVRLYRYALALADEKAFFIRKAIGWALREYARVEPEAVAAFLKENRDRFSGLTLREASKHLDFEV